MTVHCSKEVVNKRHRLCIASRRWTDLICNAQIHYHHTKSRGLQAGHQLAQCSKSCVLMQVATKELHGAAALAECTVHHLADACMTMDSLRWQAVHHRQGSSFRWTDSSSVAAAGRQGFLQPGGHQAGTCGVPQGHHTGQLQTAGVGGHGRAAAGLGRAAGGRADVCAAGELHEETKSSRPLCCRSLQRDQGSCAAPLVLHGEVPGWHRTGDRLAKSIPPAAMLCGSCKITCFGALCCSSTYCSPAHAPSACPSRRCLPSAAAAPGPERRHPHQAARVLLALGRDL